MKKNIHILLASALLIGATSCEDFLQKDPPASPSQNIFWQKKSDFDSALAGTYSVMHESVFSTIIPCFDGMTDNAIVQHDEDTYGRSKTIAQGDLTPNQTGYVTAIYEKSYVGIARVHILLEQLDKYTGTDISADQKKYIVAQCKALRGYFYSWLYECYKEVPVITNSLDMSTMYQPKATRQQMLARVLEDYGEAIANLKDEPYSLSGRFTVSAVKALKAKLLLFDAYDSNGKADAAKMAEIVTLLQSISGYELDGSVRELFLSDKQETSKEIMFSVRFLRPNLTHSIDIYFGTWNTIDPTRDLVDAFECTDGKKWGESSLTEYPDEAVLYSQASTAEAKMAEREKLFKNRDIRLIQAIGHSGILSFPEGQTITYGAGNASLTGLNLMKLIQPSNVEPDYSTVSDADIVIMRYAHVLLMLAEAENEAHGATDIALNAINEVRTRSGQPKILTGISQNDLRERIRNEWRVETCLEGLRYFQLKRWKLMGTLVNGQEDPAMKGYVKVYKPAFEFFPLPQGEIDKAGGILVQDPAYQ